jgi:hypothetical protein
MGARVAFTHSELKNVFSILRILFDSRGPSSNLGGSAKNIGEYQYEIR